MRFVIDFLAFFISSAIIGCLSESIYYGMMFAVFVALYGAWCFYDGAKSV